LKKTAGNQTEGVGRRGILTGSGGWSLKDTLPPKNKIPGF